MTTLFSMCHLEEEILLQEDAVASALPRLARIHNRKVEPPQQLNEDLVQLHIRDGLPKTLEPSISECQFFVALHELELAA